MSHTRTVKSRLGLFILFAAVLFPVIVWFLMAPLSFRFGDSFMAMTSVGQITALIGLSLFAVTLILSARLPIFEDYFGGLDRVYRIHHYSGTIAFVFLLVHPLVLAVRLIPISVVDAARFMLPSGDWALNFGLLSLMLMMSLLTVTFFAKWRYTYLRFAHQILGVAFFFGALHAFLIPSDIAQNPVLRYYMLGLAFIGLLLYSYRSLFGAVLVKKYVYRVSQVNDLGQGITEVVMVPEGNRMYYTPGQFLFISFRDGGISNEVHPFSISSAPTEDVLRITVKALGDWTSELKYLNIGSTAQIEGPFGTFSYLKSENQKQVWVAGGIGVTPFLNMARNLRVNQRPGLQIDFYYTTRTEDEMVFRAEFDAIAAACPGLRFIPYISERFGFLTAQVIQDMSGDLHATDIFVCGPPPMMQGLKTQFLAAKVPRRLIHMEEFKLL